MIISIIIIIINSIPCGIVGYIKRNLNKLKNIRMKERNKKHVVIESHDNQCLAKVTFCWSVFDLNVSMHVKKLNTTM